MKKNFITNPIYAEYKRLWTEVNAYFDKLRTHSDPTVKTTAKEIEKRLMEIDLFHKKIAESFWKELPFHESWGLIAPQVGPCPGTNSVAP